MLDSKTGQCKTKHIDTRFHWIKQYMDENKVNVYYIKACLLYTSDAADE